MSEDGTHAVTGMADKLTTGGGMSNRDWWPNQLNLKILHQNSHLSNPMGEEFNYAEEFKKLLDLDSPAADAVNAITDGAVPPYKNPDLDEKYGPEQRRIAGGGHTKGTMEKCTFCVHRVTKGQQPSCVENCPPGALIFGDLDDPESDVSKAIERPHFRLLEEAGTDPRVYYIGGQAPTDDTRQIEKIESRP